jgi:hypothetical protein
VITLRGVSAKPTATPSQQHGQSGPPAGPPGSTGRLQTMVAHEADAEGEAVLFVGWMINNIF